MASLIDELIDVLENEYAAYEKLVKISREKTPVIIEGNILELQKMVEREQDVADRIHNLEKKREEVVNDIANVINKDVTTLKVITLVNLLGQQPEEQSKLAAVHDRLTATVKAMQAVNEQNAVLLTHALEMTEFEMNLLNSMKQAPETANYNRNAVNTGEKLGGFSFDAKQ